MKDITRGQWSKLRELAALAHERELGGELAHLEREFARWRSGEIDARDLGQRIHEFHQGPARRLWTAYQSSLPSLEVASAMARGVVSEQDAGADIAELLRPAVEALRRQR